MLLCGAMVEVARVYLMLAYCRIQTIPLSSLVQIIPLISMGFFVFYCKLLDLRYHCLYIINDDIVQDD